MSFTALPLHWEQCLLLLSFYCSCLSTRLCWSEPHFWEEEVNFLLSDTLRLLEVLRRKKKKPQCVCWTLENLPQNSCTKTHLAELAWEWEVQGSQRLPWRTNTDVTWPRRAWSSTPTTRWPKDKVLWDSSHTHRASSPLFFLGCSHPETTAYTVYDLDTLWASLYFQSSFSTGVLNGKVSWEPCHMS